MNLKVKRLEEEKESNENDDVHVPDLVNQTRSENDKKDVVGDIRLSEKENGSVNESNSTENKQIVDERNSEPVQPGLDERETEPVRTELWNESTKPSENTNDAQSSRSLTKKRGSSAAPAGDEAAVISPATGRREWLKKSEPLVRFLKTIRSHNKYGSVFANRLKSQVRSVLRVCFFLVSNCQLVTRNMCPWIAVPDTSPTVY